jgi:hypothetical protein
MTAKYGVNLSHDASDEVLKEILPRHVVFSPGPEIVDRLIRETRREALAPWEFHKTMLRKLRKETIRVMKYAGAEAGQLIIHDIRLKDTVGAKVDHDQDISRYRQVLDMKGWQQRVAYSPHGHGIIFGWLEPSDAFCRETGWVYRVIRVVRDPEALVKYLLSHAPDQGGVNAIVPFGEMTPENLIKLRENRIRNFPICGECTEEGVPEVNAIRVVGTLIPGSVVYENDNNKDLRVTRGRGPPVKWIWDHISQRPFRDESTKVSKYRVRMPEEKRPPARNKQDTTFYYRRAEWEEMVRARNAPDNWFRV